jgi:broad specificity phosphatase PhoE
MKTCATSIQSGLIVYLIRHGETDSNKHLVTTGTVTQPMDAQEPSLTEIGHSQADDISLLLTPIVNENCRIYSSELKRAIQTASPLLVRTRKDITINKLFNEKTDDETMEQFMVRVQTVWNSFSDIAKGTKGETDIRIIFTHSLFISALLGSDFTTRMLHIPNGSITKIRFDTSGVGHVTQVAITSHLTNLSGVDAL